MDSGRRWTREELLLAIDLYCRTPFGRIHYRNPEIIALAFRLGRTPGSVSYKMANLAALDESLDRKGAANYSKLDGEVWKEFWANAEDCVFTAERERGAIDGDATVSLGKDRTALVKQRVGQDFFREAVLTAYDNSCCVTGISEPRLLVASHIIPWAENEATRLDIRNGLCLNALHDKAFDCGLMTLDEDFRVRYSSALAEMRSSSAGEMFFRYEGTRVRFPGRFLPSAEYVGWHRENVFVA